MSFDFYMPDIGEGVVEGEIVSWKVKEGDKVKLDQPLVEVMTDKATVELPSPRAGTVKKLFFKEGDIAPVGKILVTIEEEGAPASAGNGKPAHHEAPRPAAHAPAAVSAAPAARTPSAPPAMRSSGGIEVVDATATRERVLATPATRRLARQLGVEIGRVPATGKHGRVTTDDVRNFQNVPATTRPAQTPISISKGGEEERVPLRGIRKKIAESMSRAVHTAAHFTYVEEVDMTELVAVRERAKTRASERGVKLNYLPFIVKACVSGLKKWPQLNASLDESTQEIVRKKYYHIGIAAQGPQGLAVSVVRDADRRSIFDLSKEIERLGEAVRTGTATRDELTGSTFTISSLGKLGGVLATPIINFPEVAIVGVHKIEEKPAVRNGQIVARHLMNLSISVDHRLADGWDGAMFLQDVKTLLEDPTTMFMEMV
ncbi:MAG TPA: dihydrolipoamide acetyltransferase family protein [Kofleriaceae bacterium]|nr:dihydrolipoamide acetyltransferase family protein [Kofleriaceae bacterium]